MLKKLVYNLMLSGDLFRAFQLELSLRVSKSFSSKFHSKHFFYTKGFPSWSRVFSGIHVTFPVTWRTAVWTSQQSSVWIIVHERKMAFTFAAFCYMLALLLTAALIFFAIWHVSILIKLRPNWWDFELTDNWRIVALVRHKAESETNLEWMARAKAGDIYYHRHHQHRYSSVKQ